MVWVAMLATSHSVMANDYDDFIENRAYGDKYFIDRGYMDNPEGMESIEAESLAGIESPPSMERMMGRDYANMYIERDGREGDEEERYYIDSPERQERRPARKSIDTMDCEMPCRLPCRCDVHFTLLALRPCGDSFDYAVQTVAGRPASPSWKILNIKPDYHCAFEIGANMQPECMCGCFMVNWEHFDSQDTSTKHIPINSEDSVGPFFHIHSDSDFTRARGRVRFHFDEVNVDYGVFLSAHECLNTNFYSGVSFVHIQRDFITRYANRNQADRDLEVIRLIKTPSRFDGIGPQVGVDLTYKVAGGLCMAGGGAAGLLFGRLKNHTHFEAQSPALANTNINITPPNRQSTKVHHSRQLIPAFEGRLGIGYCTDRMDCSFRFEIGYFAQIYLNAIQSVDIASEVHHSPVSSSSVGVFPRAFERHFSNFALAGPYVTLGVRF